MVGKPKTRWRDQGRDYIQKSEKRVHTYNIYESVNEKMEKSRV
jgi:hypothetical protein